jgi:hypothetical protein
MITRKQLLALIAFVVLGAIIILMGREDSSQKNKFSGQPLLNNSGSTVNQNMDSSGSATNQNLAPQSQPPSP